MRSPPSMICSRPLRARASMSVAMVHATARASTGVSAAAIALAALAALVILGCAAWALSRRRALEPRWLLALRHSMAEAGLHASATWAEFTDWVRLGR
jgi:hypothetical protein